MHRHVMGKEGMTLAVIAWLAMTAVAFFVDMPRTPAADTGICFPSPDTWRLIPFWGWLINTLLVATVAILISVINKEYRIVSGSDTVLTGMFLILTGSNIWTSGMLTSSVCVALVNLLCISVLFGCYRRRNVARELFVLATILSVGSMFEYALVFMIPVYIIGAAMTKCLTIKSFIAFLMGLAAPWWIGLGFGIIPFDSLKLPQLSHVFGAITSKHDLFIGLLNIGVTLLIAFMLALANAVKLYAGNSRRRIFNMVINVLGLVILVCMIFDFANLPAYLTTLYLVSSVQLANEFELRNVSHGAWWIAGISAMYIGAFVLMIVR